MKDKSGEWKRCPIAKCELSFERLSLIDIVGCASHSATHTSRPTPTDEQCRICRGATERKVREEVLTELETFVRSDHGLNRQIGKRITIAKIQSLRAQQGGGP
jgi:hypothetical protein